MIVKSFTAATFLTAALLLGCGGSTHSREGDSGNTNWLKQCSTDAMCGELSCYCGSCRNACDGTLDCSIEPERACVGDSSSPAVQPPAPQTLLQVSDPEAYANDLGVLSDGSVVLVGGTDFVQVDFAATYPTFWLRRLERDGTPAWTHTEPQPAEFAGSNGLSVAITRSDEIATVSVLYDGTDTATVFRFDAAGNGLKSDTFSPAFERLRSQPDGDLLAAGLRINEIRAGRPFTSAWVGRIGADAMVWERQREGLDGSISEIEHLAVNASGDILVGGSLGISTASNAAVPWLARLNASGDFVWEQSLVVPRPSHCSVSAVALTPSGAALAAEYCAGPSVRAYAPNGRALWERRFEPLVTALASLDDGGYVVALGTEDPFNNPQKASVVRFDAQHRLVWRAEQANCHVIERLQPTERGVLALAGCSRGYSLTEYTDP